ncbi:MAG: hypothetical protein KC442_21605 [Thermomicrobiales bacterium]|nr:hypothetical protein [Thermomicrobiales bacterium]
MVPSSRAAARPDHLHTLKLPSPIQVTPCPQSGAPQRVLVRRGWREVDEVLDTWLVETEWWRPTPIRRRYFQLLLANGAPCTIFQDLCGDGWYAQPS